jgi:signal transduction histidine kinase
MRTWSLGAPRHPWIAAALLAALLGFLAVLQYRWIGEVSRAERQRLRASLEGAAERFADDLGRDVTRAFFAFQPVSSGGTAGGEQSVAERWRHWRETAPQPGLVKSVFVATWGADGRPALSRIDPATEQAVPVPWPADLLSVRRRLEEAKDGIVSGGRRFPFPIDPAVPALLAPVHRRFEGLDDKGNPPGVVIAVLDRQFLTEELFPELTERFFGVPRMEDYLVAVKGPGGLVYRSDPALPESRYLHGDLEMPLFGLHHGEGRRPGRLPGREKPPPAGEPPGGRPRNGWSIVPADNPWRLVVTHREGSLEAAVERVRWRNLAVSAGVLALLAATLTVLAASAQQARRLARQQIEFVAGITHELNTPLAAVRSAGQNLADGVVSDPQQVKRYGALIEREGRRLSGMVFKVLEYAGIQSGNKTYRPETLSLGDVVDEALADCRWVLEEKGIEVERDIAPDLPLVVADRAALRMAVQNLLDNAVKYAGAAGWIGVRGHAHSVDPDAREVCLIVEDRGPGIQAEDRPHLFEPFYRGREVAGGTIHGSGLGLSLVRHAVEAQHGSLNVATGPGGSAFTIRLPAAPAAPASATVSTENLVDDFAGEQG